MKARVKIPKINKPQNRLQLAIVLIAVLAIVSGYFLIFHRQDKPMERTLSSNFADTCAGLDPLRQNIYSCYKKKLTAIVNTAGPEKATLLLKSSYAQGGYAKSECHQLMHVVGRAAYARYGSLAEAFAHGDQFCWSGFYHGIMEQISAQKGYDYVLKNSNSICKPIAAKYGAYSFNSYNCVHGLGHGFMEVLNENLFTALSSCDAMDGDWNRNSCYGGVFMQNVMNVQGPEREDLATYKYLKADQPMYPCTAVDDKYKEQCYLMQTSFALQTQNYDFKKVFSLCAGIEPKYQDTCYQSLGRDASGTTISDPDKTKEICLSGSTLDAQTNCTIGAVKDFVSYFHSDEQGYKLCDAMPPQISDTCSQTVKSYYATF